MTAIALSSILPPTGVTQATTAQASALTAITNAATANTAVASEVARATAAETALSTALATEQNRAANAESTLTSNLATEVTRAKAAEATLTAAVAAVGVPAYGAIGSYENFTVSLVQTTLVGGGLISNGVGSVAGLTAGSWRIQSVFINTGCTFSSASGLAVRVA